MNGMVLRVEEAWEEAGLSFVAQIHRSPGKALGRFRIVWPGQGELHSALIDLRLGCFGQAGYLAVAGPSFSLEPAGIVEFEVQTDSVSCPLCLEILIELCGSVQAVVQRRICEP